MQNLGWGTPKCHKRPKQELSAVGRGNVAARPGPREQRALGRRPRAPAPPPARPAPAARREGRTSPRARPQAPGKGEDAPAQGWASPWRHFRRPGPDAPGRETPWAASPGRESGGLRAAGPERRALAAGRGGAGGGCLLPRSGPRGQRQFQLVAGAGEPGVFHAGAGTPGWLGGERQKQRRRAHESPRSSPRRRVHPNRAEKGPEVRGGEKERQTERRR